MRPSTLASTLSFPACGVSPSAHWGRNGERLHWFRSVGCGRVSGIELIQIGKFTYNVLSGAIGEAFHLMVITTSTSSGTRLYEASQALGQPLIFFAELLEFQNRLDVLNISLCT